MNYYRAERSMIVTGVYAGYKNGDYTFVLEDNDIIDFDEINKMILVEFDLKSDKCKGRKFEIIYTEIIDDLDDEDFVVLKLEDLKLI
ncbi:hypothetical protein [uncultured Tenacibaculum sp.]|uniref:hypothetical protein n=1 Tax=uncultured Tenacibaculum sp. TaxID=174713 RepID=UPI00263648E8|nr:hypothetical protein [uncultured Tenacibaculum sp.]